MSSGGSDVDSSPESATQPTQPTHAATQQPPRNAGSGSGPGVLASLVPRHPHLQPLTLETSRLLAGGYTIGRLEQCDVTLDRSYISGRHCRIFMETGADPDAQSLCIMDTSTNGTFVNDRVIGRGNRTMLLNNDRIGFLRAADALPSDIALEYSVEYVHVGGLAREHADFDADLLRTYDFKREVGVGNFAKVWLAVHKQTGTAYACKVINKKRHLFSTGLAKIFEREITIMKQLKHEHIVPLHELHVDKDRIHIFMEYIEGGDLFTYLSENGSFSETESRPLFKQACSAVRYLHANGITHRDIKLDNMLIKLAPNGSILSVKIADFGLARAVDDGGTMRTICGTPSYLAPEIVCRGSSVVSYSKSVDMWALGVVLYALHTNSFPFAKLLHHGDAADASLDAYVKASRMTATNEKFCGLSSALQGLLSGMLHIDPKTRLTIEAAIHHPWTQTSANGAPGPLHEPVEVWGVLHAVTPGPSSHKPGRATEPIRVDMFRSRTVIGRGRTSHIQIPDPRISSSHCEVLFRDSGVHLRSAGRSPCWVEGRPVGSGCTQVLRPPYEFSLRPDMPKANTSQKHASYRFRVEVFEKPWKVAWVAVSAAPATCDLAAPGVAPSGSGDSAGSIDAAIPGLSLSRRPSSQPPPLVLPVASAHLSLLPLGSAKDVYVVGGQLLFDPTKEELDAVLEASRPQPWAMLCVLGGDSPRLHILDSSVAFGRSSDCAVTVSDARISQRHCSIELDGGRALVTNHSSNGTFVNATRVEGPAVLKAGDELVLLYDRIAPHAEDAQWLGQAPIVDRFGYPVLVGYRVAELRPVAPEAGRRSQG